MKLDLEMVSKSTRHRHPLVVRHRRLSAPSSTRQAAPAIVAESGRSESQTLSFALGTDSFLVGHCIVLFAIPAPIIGRTGMWQIDGEVAMCRDFSLMLPKE